MIHDPELASSASKQLGAMIDRAQDERLRLMRMVKEYEGKLDAIPEPVSADHVQRLMQLVTRVGDAMNQRMDTLAEMDKHIDHRLDQMARLEASLIDLTATMSKQLEEARGFGALVDSAKRQVRAAAAAAKADIEGSQTAAPTPRLANEEHRPLRALAARLNAQTG